MADEKLTLKQVSVRQQLRRAERGLYPDPEGIAHFGWDELQQDKSDIGGLSMSWDVWVSMGRPTQILIRVSPVSPDGSQEGDSA